MTPSRYHAYRRICSDLDQLSDTALAPEELSLIRDAAEGLLLAREGEDDLVDECRGRLAMALSILVGLGRWTDEAADELWRKTIACGPLETDRPGVLTRVVEHA